MVICLEQGADLHMVQLMPLPLTIFCYSKIQIGVTFLVPAHPGSHGKGAVKRVCVCGGGLLCVSPYHAHVAALPCETLMPENKRLTISYMVV